MSKDKYFNRLEELFSSSEPAEPEATPQGSSGMPSTPVHPGDEINARVGTLAADIGALIGQIRDLPQLLAAITELIHQQFQLYATQIYLADSSGKNLMLLAASGENGKDLLRRGRRVSVTPGTIIGSAADERKPLRVTDTNSHPLYQYNPLLPETSAELVLPIVLGDRLVGVIDMQGRSPENLPPEKARLDMILRQIAAGIENVRFLNEAEQARAEAEALSRQTVQAGWQDFLDGIQHGERIGYVFDQNLVRPLTDPLPEKGKNSVDTPIVVSGQAVGALRLEELPDTLSGEEENQLLATISQRLSQQIENLRLLEEARRYRQEAEQAIRRLTRQNWETYLAGASATATGYVYDLNRVMPLLENEPPHDPATTVSLPLRVQNEPVGSLQIHQAEALDEETQQLLNIITERLSNHLESLRLTEQREQALAETEMLYSISARLSTAQNLDEALFTVSDPAIRSGAISSRLLTVSVHKDGKPVEIELVAGWDRGAPHQYFRVGDHVRLADFPSTHLWVENPDTPIMVNNINTDVRLDPNIRKVFQQIGAQSGALLPLAIGNQWVGIMLIFWGQLHYFTEVEQRLYKSLASQAAVVVNNRLLLEQTNKRATELETVAKVSIATSSVLSPQELMQSVVDLTRTSFGLHHAQIFLLNEELNILELGAGSGEIGEKLIAAHHFVPLNDRQSLVARTAREAHEFIINDVHVMSGFTRHPLLAETMSELAIPMIVGDHLFGVFDVHSTQTNRFGEEDARIFMTLSSQVAIALQNARLYAEEAATVERLRELDQLKSAFLANMSHELRTPLNSIQGFTEVILLGLDGPLTEQMENDLHLIEKSSKHLLSLINDVLDMAKIEAGKMNLNFETFKMRDLMREAMDITGSLARDKALDLLLEPDAQLDFELTGDRTRLRQVLINLIGNSVKFTEHGSIRIQVTQPTADKLQVRIKDTGIGVPRDKHEMIFEAFSQVDTSTTRKAGGTGLGLPISRRLIEMHGGRLWVESAGLAGEGSTFIIEMPLHPPQAGN